MVTTIGICVLCQKAVYLMFCVTCSDQMATKYKDTNLLQTNQCNHPQEILSITTYPKFNCGIGSYQ